MAGPANGKISTPWLIVISVFIFVIAAGAFLLMMKELPPCAEPEAIEKRFAEQIACLRELAESCDADGFIAGPPSGKEEGAESIKRLKDSEAWWKSVEEKADLFSDPVILGVSVVIIAPNMQISHVVKEYDEPSGSFPLSGEESGVDRPATRLLFAGARFFVEYENRFMDESGMERGYRMILDLDLLEEN